MYAHIVDCSFHLALFGFVYISLIVDGPQREWGQENNHFPCPANHEQDWQPYPVDPSLAICDDHTYTNTTLSSCLWSLRNIPSLTGPRLTIVYRDASSALLQLVNQWLNFTYSRSHAFRYECQNKNPALTKIELTTSAPKGVRCYLLSS